MTSGNTVAMEPLELFEHGMKVVEKAFVEWRLFMNCNLALCLKDEQLMLCLS